MGIACMHVGRICQRLYPKLGLLNRISSFLPSLILLRIYKQTILPILDYGSTVWHECGTIQTRRVEKLQNLALRITFTKARGKCCQEMRSELKLLTLHSRRRFLRFTSIFKILYNLDCPSQLRDTFKFKRCMHNRDLRDKTLLDLPKVNSAIGQSAFNYAGAKDLNSLPEICNSLNKVFIIIIIIIKKKLGFLKTWTQFSNNTFVNGLRYLFLDHLVTVT